MHEDEALSMFMDGEIRESDVDNLLAAIANNMDLLAKWHRYHIARSILRKENIVVSRLTLLRTHKEIDVCKPSSFICYKLSSSTDVDIP